MERKPCHLEVTACMEKGPVIKAGLTLLEYSNSKLGAAGRQARHRKALDSLPKS